MAQPRGTPVAAARIVLERVENTAAPREAESDARGEFQFPAVEPGEYRVRASAPGYFPAEARLVVGPRQPISFQLELAPQQVLAQQVQVRVQDSAGLEPTQTGASRLLTRQTLDELPSSLVRDVPTLAENIFPGATLSHDNFIHVRGNEVSLHEFIDGVSFLDNPQQQFSPGLNPQVFEAVRLITGWFPAEIGNRFGGVLDITTRSGHDLAGHGSARLSEGTFGTDDASVEYGGTAGRFGYYAFADGSRSNWFLNTPMFKARHDSGNTLQGTLQLDYQGNRDSWKLLLLGGGANFELPNNQEQESLGRNASRRLRSETAIFGWQHIFSARALFSASFYERTVSDRLLPTADPLTEFGAGSHGTLTAGIQSDFSYARGGHIFKLGVDLRRLRLLEDFHFDPRDQGLTAQGELDAFGFRGARRGGEASLYAQDHITLARNLSADLGLRWDQLDLVETGAQVSPRTALAWRIDRTRSVLHFAYSRFFSPHPLEDSLLASFLGATASDPAARVGPAKPYTQNYYELGWNQELHSKLSLELNTYVHRGENPFEYREIGTTRLFLPINFASAHSSGAELSLVLKQLERVGLSGRLEYAVARTYFFGPISGGFTNGENVPPGARILPAFDQTHTGTASLFCRSGWRSFRSGLHLRYGSGTPAQDGAFRLPQHLTADLVTGLDLWKAEPRRLALEFDLTNLSDNRYRIAKESESTPIQFAPPRVASVYLKLDF